MFEIQASKAILGKTGIDQKVHDYAQMMVTAHTATSNQLKPIAKAESLTVPMTLDADHQAMLDKINAADGAAAASLYIDQQTTRIRTRSICCRPTPRAATTRSSSSSRRTSQPTVQAHLDDAKALKAPAGTSPNM